MPSMAYFALIPVNVENLVSSGYKVEVFFGNFVNFSFTCLQNWIKYYVTKILESD
jgi:hypothetical protein